MFIRIFRWEVFVEREEQRKRRLVDWWVPSPGDFHLWIGRFNFVISQKKVAKYENPNDERACIPEQSP